MAEAKIKGGYILQPRIIKDSEMSHLAPCVREVLSTLLREVKYKDTDKLKKGQCFIRMDDLREILHWYVGFRKMMYSRRQIEGAMNVLRERGTIVTTKVTHGMVVTICKYDYYQDPNNYEGDDEGATKVIANVQRRSKGGDNNIKKEKKEKKVKKEEDVYLQTEKKHHDKTVIPFEIRKEEFRKEVMSFSGEFDNIDDNELDFFFSHWSEEGVNKYGQPMMRKELNGPWNTRTRLRKWKVYEKEVNQ